MLGGHQRGKFLRVWVRPESQGDRRKHVSQAASDPEMLIPATHLLQL